MKTTPPLRTIAQQLVLCLSDTPIDTIKLETVLKSYSFPPRKATHFTQAMRNVLASRGQIDVETQLRLQILEMTYCKLFNQRDDYEQTD